MRIPAKLAEGYELFRRGQFPREVDRYRALAHGQRPETMVIACADSRVDPAMIFQAAPGELFVVRNVAALVPPYEEFGSYHGTSAAIEFAVTHLAVKSIIVLGHGQCGGISASLAATDRKPGYSRFIGPWVSLISDVRDELIRNHPNQTLDERQQVLEELAVKRSLMNLRTFPFVDEAIALQRLNLHGAWFSIGRGELRWLDNDRGDFGVVPTIVRKRRN